MTFSGFLSFALVYFVFVITPGPGIAATVARGLGIGLRHAAPFIFGFVLGDLTWFTIAASGLAALANHFAASLFVLKVLGCAYLIYLAWKMWNAPVFADDVGVETEATSAWGSFVGTLTLTWGNPKVAVFFLSLMPVAVEVDQMTLPTYFQLVALMAVMCGFNIFIYLVLAHRARLVFASAKALQRINRGAAALMATAAGAIIVKG